MVDDRKTKGRCVDCAEKLSSARRIFGTTRCPVCEAAFEVEIEDAKKQRAAERQQQRRDYSEVLEQIVPGVDMRLVERRVAAAKSATPLSPEEIELLDSERVTELFGTLTRDRLLDANEDLWLNRVLTILGTQMNDQHWRDYLIMALNSGLILRDPDPPNILARAHEQFHFHCLAARLEATPQQELRWSGVELNSDMDGKALGTAISKGRAKIVTTGTEINRTDTGPLVVSSERVLFLGEQTSEVNLEQLVGVNISNGKIQLQVSGRQESLHFEVGSPGDEVAATVILTSAKRKMGLLVPPKPSSFPTKELPRVPRLLEEAGYTD
jgi:uncharacterized Zn finger protein (UPF0148 family)